jgi:hypothetical protein
MIRCKPQNFLKGKIWQNRAYKAKLHGAMVSRVPEVSDWGKYSPGW